MGVQEIFCYQFGTQFKCSQPLLIIFTSTNFCYYTVSASLRTILHEYSCVHVSRVCGIYFEKNTSSRYFLFRSKQIGLKFQNTF